MGTPLEQLEAWLQADSEHEHLEFKEAKGSYHFENLVDYCVALANEGGGKIILGVTDTLPRRVVGTEAFRPVARTQAGLFQRLNLRIEAEEFPHPDGRVLIFHVPPRPLGAPVQYKGRYLMRVGEELRPMTPEQLKRIFDEAVPDFSGEVCPRADLSWLSLAAIRTFRQKWAAKSRNRRLRQLGDEQLLTDAELMVEGRLTNAALILLGTRAGLTKAGLAQAEVIFEFRLNEASIGYDDRESYREGLLLYVDRFWETINLRNEIHQVQEGLVRRDLRSFAEPVVREALLNAVAHRDYRSAGSVFARQSPHKLVIESPGGFPPGITPENILRKHLPRNRLIADSLERCGFVERSGQGVRLMFEESIREAKLPPDYAGSDDYWVRLTLWGEVEDDDFVRLLEGVGEDIRQTLTTEDYLTLDHVRRGLQLPAELRARLPHLLSLGLVTGGLDRETSRELLLQYITDRASEGSRLSDLRGLLPALTERQVRHLLSELKGEARIRVAGRTKAARWYPASDARPD